MKLPIIGISMGDPAGVGPEIAVKALNHESVNQTCCPLIVGDAWTIERELKKYAPGKSLSVVKSISGCRFSADTVNVLDLEIPGCPELAVGKISPVAGHVSFSAVKKLIELGMNGEIDATVTGPIHKKAINDAGHHFAGHTEIFAKYTGTDNYAMMLACEQLKVIHITTHVSLREALDQITEEKVYSRIKLMHDGLNKIGISEPRIGVAGLNPHAWDEEKQSMQSVIGVNITLGLPIIRTSVDHGTAFDIAGKGIASDAALLDAIEYAIRIYEN
jgi:4-hydroxythreonine-4-phosphate dehydrogenase